MKRLPLFLGLITAVFALIVVLVPVFEVEATPANETIFESSETVVDNDSCEIMDGESTNNLSCCSIEKIIQAERICLRRGPNYAASFYCTSSGGCGFFCERL